MWKILSFAFSMFLQVYWYRIRKKSDVEWDALWGKRYIKHPRIYWYFFWHVFAVPYSIKGFRWANCDFFYCLYHE